MIVIRKTLLLQVSSQVLHTIMPLLTKVNQYPCRYRPYSQPITLHSTFSPKRHSFTSHSLFIVYPIDSDPTVFETPQLLVPHQAKPSATSYFTSVSHEIPQIKIRKPPGEAGHPGAGHQGYLLSTILKWPDEVYKEVQVSESCLFLSK